MNMQKLNLITWVIVLFSSWAADATKYNECGSANAYTLSVEITPCDSDPCVLVTGQPVTVGILFTATADIQGGSASMQVVQDTDIRWLPPPNKTLCECLNPSCPIEGGGTYDYKYTLELPDTIPSHQVDIRWELFDEREILFLCVQFPMEIRAL
ncbi:Phosphatidylglycerol/phosphatidylinositol transfer protein [Clonorchis sinensis]|uniref:Phosphatidylglycerol/phosphatidylinositol transfer protein n=1 Tax=Clonorchis sinensis TaxID=79923 RepID=A0A8T1MW35_CLOSI|nr:Phosphatidylglycerol/phosphatidylinositol transfer protein [Clonorchis sinensis]